MDQNPQKNSKKHSKYLRGKFKPNLKLDILQQIILLLEYADEVILTNEDLAQTYARQARKLQMKARIKFPPEWKKRFCKHCKTFLHPGVNATVRLSSTNKILAIKCLKCGGYTRIPYSKKLRGKK